MHADSNKPGATQPVGRVRHFNYSGIARNGFSQEAVLNDDAPSLPDGTLLYAAPQASEAVRDEDVVTLLNFIFERFSAPCKAGDLPGYVVPAIRRLERAALSAQPSGNPGDLAAQPGAQKEQSDA